MSRGYVYLELRRTLRYGAPGARIDINIPKNRASCTTRLARSRSPIIVYLMTSLGTAVPAFQFCGSNRIIRHFMQNQLDLTGTGHTCFSKVANSFNFLASLVIGMVHH